MGKRNVNVLAGLTTFLESQMHASLMEKIGEIGGVGCQENMDVFFPETGDFREIREAKSICRACPLIDLCGEYAIRFNVTDGIWGGLTPTERKRERVRATTGKVFQRRLSFQDKVSEQMVLSNKVRRDLASAEALELLPKALLLKGDKITPEAMLVVEARLANPSLPLKALGELFDPPLSKDVVAGRLRRVLAIVKKEQ